MITSDFSLPAVPGPLARQLREARRSFVWLVPALLVLAGCGSDDVEQATVQGTLRLQGQTLDNCLVMFLPEATEQGGGRHSTGLTDAQGVYRLRFDDQQEGAVVGWHRIVLQDLSASTGVRRRDHGTVDENIDESEPPPAMRPSRIHADYTTAASTKLRKEVRPGDQVIDLDL